MTNSIEFMKKYCDFSDPNWVWIMKGVARNKDNPDNPNMHKLFRRMIVTKPSDIESCYNEIKLIANDVATNYRIYISLNSRDAFKGAFQFHKKMDDVIYDLARNIDDALVQSKKLGSIWKTELEQRSCRGTKRFLLDIDNLSLPPDRIYEYMEETMRAKIHCCQKTVSGWAIVFDACDTRTLLEVCKAWGYEVDIQRDSMLFVEKFMPFGG